MKKILIIFGTRPEAIKMVPVIKEFKKNTKFVVKVCITGQHREMLDQVLSVFKVTPDYDLDVMKAGQSLAEVTSSILIGLEQPIEDFRPDLIVVHGDTITAFASSLSAYFNKIDVAHVEAGLRTFDIYSPWPEEINRKLIASIAKFHFSPTENASKNLINENIDKNRVYVTGNTVIDTLKDSKEIIYKRAIIKSEIKSKLLEIDFTKKIILVTGHRRESFGSGFKNICISLLNIAKQNPNIQIVYPVHLNPKVNLIVREMLKDVSNIILLPPVDYLTFVFLMDQCYLILTDSGGIQEEAPALKKPVLVMRNTTERPEAIENGLAKLVGTTVESIVENTNQIINNEKIYTEMQSEVNPYGDGHASERIVDIVYDYYDKEIR